MTNSTLILLRHGESLWNHENRFTGWTDVPLTPAGRQEANRAGVLLREAGIFPDFACSSVLTRTIHTLWTVLDQIDRAWIPAEMSWRLNERHYGALQGLNKAETTLRLGEERVRTWRKTFTGVPPADVDAPARLQQTARYRNIALADLPTAESLAMTIERVLVYWQQGVVPHLLAGKTVLVVSHKNALRALIKFLNGLDDEAVTHLRVPTGVPLVYQMDPSLTVLTQRVLT
ncbi:2,3-bisphosphoglycerate-dependent phosphoglycerate mutase [Erwinia oleae]|uniref:2,3-bisphosphoglycerate-dependent phosphoglycerate mutase n=1 Tax=Erwinia oleae TaxID=796334 RepID=UPI00055537B1|nr:2,3-bisphosphoglycerate-dependent phosphoglycerate mutase [Erwinia oleae]